MDMTEGSDLSRRGSTVDRLITVAERLFAQHGLDGVSLRQIAAEAGTSNNSAVRYHFGSKEALITAILEFRLPPLIARRELLAARADSDDLRSILEAHLLPVVDLAETGDNHYLMFLQQLQHYGRDHPFLHLTPALQDSQRGFLRTAGRFLGHLPDDLRIDRLHSVNTICLHTSADRQRAHYSGAPQRPYALHVNDLFDGLTGYLMADASPATRRALATPARQTRSPGRSVPSSRRRKGIDHD